MEVKTRAAGVEMVRSSQILEKQSTYKSLQNLHEDNFKTLLKDPEEHAN